MEIVGCVEGGDKRAGGVFMGTFCGSGWPGELGSVKKLSIARRACGLSEHKASETLRAVRMVQGELSAAGSVGRWHNGVGSG